MASASACMQAQPALCHMPCSPFLVTHMATHHALPHLNLSSACAQASSLLNTSHNLHARSAMHARAVEVHDIPHKPHARPCQQARQDHASTVHATATRVAACTAHPSLASSSSWSSTRRFTYVTYTTTTANMGHQTLHVSTSSPAMAAVAGARSAGSTPRACVNSPCTCVHAVQPAALWPQLQLFPDLPSHSTMSVRRRELAKACPRACVRTSGSAMT